MKLNFEEFLIFIVSIHPAACASGVGLVLYQHGNDTKCPLCRACKSTTSGPNLPYGLVLDENARLPARHVAIQPGYPSEGSLFQKIRQRVDWKRGFVGHCLMGNYDLIKCLFCSWTVPDKTVDKIECLLYVPFVMVIAVSCTVFVCIDTTLFLTASCCFLCDCCHICYPQYGFRRKCLVWWTAC